MKNATPIQTMVHYARPLSVTVTASVNVHIAPLSKPAVPRTACSQL